VRGDALDSGLRDLDTGRRELRDVALDAAKLAGEGHRDGQ
jgi:hypothetical protein